MSDDSSICSCLPSRQVFPRKELSYNGQHFKQTVCLKYFVPLCVTVYVHTHVHVPVCVRMCSEGGSVSERQDQAGS